MRGVRAGAEHDSLTQSTAQMTEESRGVRVTALLLGQDSFRDERGRAHVIGIFDTVGSQQFPMAFQFSIYCRLHGEGQHELLLRVLDPNGMEIVKSEPIMANLLPIQGHQFFMSIGIQAESDGLYLVQAIVDGGVAQEAPLLVESGSDEWHHEADPLHLGGPSPT